MPPGSILQRLSIALLIVTRQVLGRAAIAAVGEFALRRGVTLLRWSTNRDSCFMLFAL